MLILLPAIVLIRRPAWAAAGWVQRHAAPFNLHLVIEHHSGNFGPQSAGVRGSRSHWCIPLPASEQQNSSVPSPPATLRDSPGNLCCAREIASWITMAKISSQCPHLGCLKTGTPTLWFRPAFAPPVCISCVHMWHRANCPGVEDSPRGVVFWSPLPPSVFPPEHTPPSFVSLCPLGS